MNAIKSFFNNVSYTLFNLLTDREIYNRIFPHLQHEADHGYPFDSHEEMLQLCEDKELAAMPFVQSIERDIARMPKGCGQALRYILYRELKANKTMSRERARMYRMYAHAYTFPETCDPRLVAKQA